VAADPVDAVLEAHDVGRPIALLTSGSTGAPRSVVRSTHSWFASFEHVADATGLGAGSRLWLPGPLAATMNLFAAVLARRVGAAVVAESADATHAHLTPAVLERLLAERLPLDGLHLTVAGDRLTPQLRDRTERAGAVVDHYYGSSELSFVAWGADERSLRAFPGVELTVEDGEIWARSPYLCDGYDGPPGPLRRRADGFATVGDRGRLVDGVLSVAGRGADAVTTGGATVLVADIEQVVRDAARCEAVVLGLPHATLGQVVAAALTDPGDLAQVRAAAQHRLDAAQRPRQWFHVPVLPLNEAGKVDRSAVLATITGADAVRLSPVAQLGDDGS
jgi:acyl-CoA synthetase (AMP-forming)/AMP-acid ligase II